LIHRRFRSCGLLAAAVLSLARPAVALAAEERLLLEVYGLSYHTDRAGVHAAHLDNERNPGLGLKYEFGGDPGGIGFVEGGVYKDSGSRWTSIAGPGYQLKLGERWRAGGALLFFDSPTYNHGRPFVAPIPIVSYDFGLARLNAVYAPRVPDLNEFAVFGFYLSIPLPR